MGEGVVAGELQAGSEAVGAGGVQGGRETPKNAIKTDVRNVASLKISLVASRHGACSHCARQVVLRCGNPNFKLFDTLLPPT